MIHHCVHCDQIVINNSLDGGICPTCGRSDWDSECDDEPPGIDPWDDAREPYIREIDDD